MIQVLMKMSIACLFHITMTSEDYFVLWISILSMEHFYLLLEKKKIIKTLWRVNLTCRMERENKFDLIKILVVENLFQILLKQNGLFFFLVMSAPFSNLFHFSLSFPVWLESEMRDTIFQIQKISLLLFWSTKKKENKI